MRVCMRTYARVRECQSFLLERFYASRVPSCTSLHSLLVSVSMCMCPHILTPSLCALCPCMLTPSLCAEDEGVLGGHVPRLRPALQGAPRHGADRAHSGRPAPTGCRSPRQVNEATTTPRVLLHDRVTVMYVCGCLQLRESSQ